jgi:hypothetical protein
MLGRLSAEQGSRKVFFVTEQKKLSEIEHVQDYTVRVRSACPRGRWVAPRTPQPAPRLVPCRMRGERIEKAQPPLHHESSL